MIPGLESLFVIVVIAALTPIVLGLVPRLGIPAVVVFLVAGVIVGPSGLDIAQPDDVSLLAKVGLGFLFLLAGYEIKLEWFAARSGRIAIVSWFVTVALALAVTGALAAAGVVKAYLPVALALTTTALGTLLPILRDAGMLRGRFSELVLASGAVGELFPIIAIAILLGSGGSFAGIASLAFMSLVGLILVAIPRWMASSRINRIITSGRDSTSQTTLRITVALLVGLLLLAEDFGIDVVLGAFIAGMVLRKWGPSDPDAFDAKLDAIGYGFFIPIFFVASGMTIEVDEIAAAPERLLLFFVLLLVVRGGPTLLVYRSSLRRLRPRTSLTFLNATALPLIVALTEIGLETGVMLPENAAALVGAGALSVLVFPLIATRLYDKDRGLHPDDYLVSEGDEQDLLPDLRDGGDPSAR